MSSKQRPQKVSDILQQIKNAIDSGRYRDTTHARDRQDERRITRQEYVHVLCNGWHERVKDRFDEGYQAWNYAIRGRTLDNRDIRVIVTFEGSEESELLLIITVIEVSDAKT